MRIHREGTATIAFIVFILITLNTFVFWYFDALLILSIVLSILFLGFILRFFFDIRSA